MNQWLACFRTSASAIWLRAELWAHQKRTRSFAAEMLTLPDLLGWELGCSVAASGVFFGHVRLENLHPRFLSNEWAQQQPALPLRQQSSQR